MAEVTNVHENSSVAISNDKTNDSNINISDTSQVKLESTSVLNTKNESCKTQTNHSIPHNTSDDINNSMSKISVHENRSSLNSNNSSSHINQSDAQAQLAAFTPPLMSIQLPYQESQIRQRSSRPYISHQQAYFPIKSKSETTITQPEYYVDSFQSNFSDKSSSTSNNDNNKTKTKHVTFQEPDNTFNESSKTHSNTNHFPISSSNHFNYSASNWTNPQPAYRNLYPWNQHNHYLNYRYGYNRSYPQQHNMMMNPRPMIRPRGMNTMQTPLPLWMVNSYNQNYQRPYIPQQVRTRQLYDPNQPKISSKTDFHDSSKVIRNIPPKNKKKTKQTTHIDDSPVTTPNPIPHPITILRKPSTDTEISTLSKEEDQKQLPSTNSIDNLSNEPQQQAINSSNVLSQDEKSINSSSDVPIDEEKIISPSTDDHSEPNTNLPLSSHELLSILQIANCISSLNKYAQQKRIPVNYEYFSTSPSLFICKISINNRQFPPSSPCSSKIEAQKLACDQALRILYRESCSIEQSSIQFSDKHDYIAHRSISTFQELNINELLLGRKTLSCILMVINQQYDQARVISIATGNSCLDETNLNYSDDGTYLHDCHAEILARRGLIKYFFQQIKQSKDNQSSIFEYNSELKKYQLNNNITFHMYISSLPCGNASLNISSNSLRYKQGQIEGTILANTIKYPIKSCSDKIYRWNILGIQGGLLINFLLKPIYLETITIACETTFDRKNVQNSLSEYLNEYINSLPLSYEIHIPDIDCPKNKLFQQERQVAKLQTNAFAWNITEPDNRDILEPRIGRLKNNRSISSLSKRNFFEDFLNIYPEKNLKYQQAKQLDEKYILVKTLISTAFQKCSSDKTIPWLSKSDQLEQFSIE